jgi:hypothetical protein
MAGNEAVAEVASLGDISASFLYMDTEGGAERAKLFYCAIFPYASQ